MDPEMVTVATEATRHLPNVSIRQGDVTNLSFEAASFDIVIESLVFHHLTDDQKRKAISEIARVLGSDGGLFFFVDWVKPEGVYSKVAFNIVKILDGKTNLVAHETNAVLGMIEKEFDQQG